MSFQAALAAVLELEGGYVNDPDDVGGATNLGVTEAVYHAWLRKHGKPTRPVATITREEAEAVYREEFWQEVGGDGLPWEVAFMAFDSAVQHGPRTAVLLLQRAARVTMDGVVGPATTAAVWSQPETVARRIFILRMRRYLDRATKEPSQRKFLRGWMERLWKVGKLAGIPEAEL